MNRPSPFDIGARCVATARAIIKSPANVAALPWIAITMQELANHATRPIQPNELPCPPTDISWLDDSELITGY